MVKEQVILAELEALKRDYEQAQAALQECQVKMAGILAIAHEAIIAIDEAQHITLFNHGAERIFGYAAAEALKQPLDILLPARYIRPHQRRVVEFAGAEESARLKDERREIVGLRKNGEEFPAEASISKFEVNGRLAMIVVLRDVTERKRAEERQQKLIEELDAFAHTISHGLDDPLVLVMGYAALLKEEAGLPDKWQYYLDAIFRYSRKMNNIIDELQVLAGVRQAEVKLEPLNMARIVAEARQRLAYLIEEHQAQINAPESWPVALGYAPWVEQIWVNYISNGLKYGGRPPRLQLGATARSDGLVRFWVRDNGPGLTPEAQTHLFTPFTRLNQVRVAGQGLGLSIVQRLVERLGGQVAVESEGRPGQGAIFSFTLQQVGPDWEIEE
jgi:PAS domain S-box-containing protein